MAPTDSELPWERWQRVRFYAALTFVLALLIPLESLSTGALVFTPLVVRTLWTLLSAALTLAAARLEERWLPWLDVVTTLVFAVGMVVVLWFTGRSSNPGFPWLAAVPLAVAITPISLLHWLALASASLVSLVGMAAMLHVDSAPAGLWQVHGLMAALGYLAAMFRAQQEKWRRQQARALLAEYERMLAALQESERLKGRTERLEMVGQLAAGVAHEINNPLAFSRANVTFVAEKVAGQDEELTLALAETVVGLDRIQAIVAELRAFTREGAEEPVATLLGEVIREVRARAEARTRRPDVTLAFEVDERLQPVRVVRDQLAEVLLNLVDNALAAMNERPQGGAVSLTASQQERQVVITVDDDGPGLSPEVEARLFRPFFSTRPVGQGTGLSLALSREYVARWGGTLSGENRAGGGARFVVRLPAVNA